MKRLWSRILWHRYYGVIPVTVLCMAILTGCSAKTGDQETQGEESPVVETTETGVPSDTMEAAPEGETSDAGEMTPAGEASDDAETTPVGETSEIGDVASEGEGADTGETTAVGKGSDAGKKTSAAGSSDVKGKTSAGAGGTKKNNTNRTQGTGNTTPKRNNSKKKASVTSKRDQQQADTASVTLNQAKEIALKKAGLSERDGNWTKQETDREHGRKVYELEFVSRNMEYDFEIDAGSGKILEYEKDLIHD